MILSSLRSSTFDIRHWTFPRIVGLGLLIVGTAGFVGFRSGERAALARAEQSRHPLEWNGHDWSEELQAGEKLAYLAGFLAGAGASQAYPDADQSEFDPEEYERRVSELREKRGLDFPFGPSLYHARLHDYYFYIDRRERPIYRAIAELNFRLQREHN